MILIRKISYHFAKSHCFYSFTYYTDSWQKGEICHKMKHATKNMKLQVISNTSAHHVSVISRKLEVHPIIWASSQENLLLPYANNKGADQLAHPCSLISTFVVRCLDSITPLVSISEISSLYLASVAEQAGLGLTWSQTLKAGFLVTWLISQW